MSIPFFSRYCLILYLSLWATWLYADNNPQDLILRFEHGEVVLRDQNKTILFQIPIEEIHGVMIRQQNIRSLLVDFQNETLPLPISYNGGRHGNTAIILKQAPYDFIKHRLLGHNKGELFWHKQNTQADFRYQGVSEIDLQETYPQQLLVEIQGAVDVMIDTTAIPNQKRIKSRLGGANTVYKSTPDKSVFLSVQNMDTHISSPD